MPFFAAFALGGIAIAGVCIELRAHRADITITASNGCRDMEPLYLAGKRAGHLPRRRADLALCRGRADPLPP